MLLLVVADPVPAAAAALPAAACCCLVRASGVAELTAYIYLLRWDTRLVVSDVDGTITRSDLLGHVLPVMGVDWSHPGITQLFHNIDKNGYQIMFLSSR
jgi:phosphatidate phosphatase LPIN